MTLAERPDIFVNIPQTSARTAYLVFRSETDYQRALLPIPATGGLVRFRLPEDSPALKVAQTYQWSLMLVCGEYFTLNDPVITGWVRRVPSPPSEQRSDREVSSTVQWLGENGYWYDLPQYLMTRPQARR